MTEQGENTKPSASGSNKRRDAKIMKRAKAAWDAIISGLGNCSEEDKLKKIETEYIKLYVDYSDANKESKLKERSIQQYQKDYAQALAEIQKAVTARTRLENLARELQKQNKDIKDENFNRLKEEEEKRKEVSANFTEKLNSIAALMDENKDKSIRLQEENLAMTAKLTDLYQQFQERETHLSNVNNKMELQRELSETQMQQLKIEFEVERQVWARERSYLLDNFQKSEEANKVLQENVRTLQENLSTYQIQYNDFKSTMERSNQVFDSFKTEISKMHKSNATLEKERDEWQNRWKNDTQTIFQITELHQQNVAEQDKLKRKVAALEKLCRQVNHERSIYLQALKSHNIQAIIPEESTDEIPAAITSNNSSKVPNHRPTEKEIQLRALKEELKILEEQQAKALEQEQALSSSTEAINLTNCEETKKKEIEATNDATQNECSDGEQIIDNVPI